MEVDGKNLAIAAKLMSAVGVPVMLALMSFSLARMAATDAKLSAIDGRLVRVETKIDDKLADVYPRGEATQAFATRDIRLRDAEHRLAALEDARRRP